MNVDEVNTEIKGLTVYPNPTSDLINFKTNATLVMQVIDINGRLVGNYGIENGSSIDTQSWLKGVYFLNLTDEQGHSKHLKLIVQ